MGGPSDKVKKLANDLLVMVDDSDSDNRERVQGIMLAACSLLRSFELSEAEAKQIALQFIEACCGPNVRSRDLARVS